MLKVNVPPTGQFITVTHVTTGQVGVNRDVFMRYQLECRR